MQRNRIIIITVSLAALVLLVLLWLKRKGDNKMEAKNTTDNRKTATGLVRYAQAQLGRPYWWGTSGQISSQALLNSLKKLYPDTYAKPMYANAPQQLGVKVHDCMGLIEGYMWSEGPDSPAKYNSNGFADTTADRLLASATDKGAISTIPEIPGISVHMKGHVGIYEGKGNVIEARGHQYGVVRTRLKDRPWTHWARIPQLEY